MAIEIDEPTFVETVLHYGLLLGAVFQLVCIFAVIFIPQSQNDQVNIMLNEQEKLIPDKRTQK